MSTRASTTAPQPHAPPSSSAFFQQRDTLVNDIALSLEHVLQNINKLNRSLEGVIAVGNEFGAVEALWSQFEGVMAQDPAASGSMNANDADRDHDDEELREDGDGVEDKAEKEEERKSRR